MNAKKNNLLISCEEAKHICDKAQYGEATLIEKFKLSLRIFWCKATKSYSKRNVNLTKLCEEAQIKTLDAQKKNEMKKKIDTFQSQT